LGINNNSGFNWNGNLTANATLTKKQSAQSSFFYNASRILLQGRIKEIYSLEAIFRKDILKTKGNFSLNS
jgi:hypothetical protein